MDDLNRSTHIFLLYLAYKRQFTIMGWYVSPFQEYREIYLTAFGED